MSEATQTHKYRSWMYLVRLVRNASASFFSKNRIIELVYVLGMASANHHPRPPRNPLPFAETYD